MSRRLKDEGSATAAKLPRSLAHVNGSMIRTSIHQLRDPSYTAMKAWLRDHGSETVKLHLAATSQSTTSSVDGQVNQSPK